MKCLVLFASLGIGFAIVMLIIEWLDRKEQAELADEVHDIMYSAHEHNLIERLAALEAQLDQIERASIKAAPKEVIEMARMRGELQAEINTLNSELASLRNHRSGLSNGCGHAV